MDITRGVATREASPGRREPSKARQCRRSSQFAAHSHATCAFAQPWGGGELL